MIKAGALYYAVFVSFIIILISGFLIFSNYLTRQNLNYFLKHDQLKSNVASAYTILLDKIEIVEIGNEKSIVLFEEDNQEVTITKSNWGLYYLVGITSEWKNIKEKSIALVGLDVFQTERIALYLSDLNNSLSLSGNTLIRGICYLPKQLVKRAYIEGRSFSRSNLIEGEQRISKSTLPDYEDKILKKNLSYLNGKFSDQDSVILAETSSKIKEIYNSFENKTLVINFHDSINYIDKTIKGNIVLYSKNEIVIDAYAKLEDVLIYARKITVKSWFEGNIQAFAGDTLIVEKNCSIKYPGSLVLYHAKKSPVLFEINENTSIYGDILVINKEKIDRDPSIFKIKKNVEINGQVYSNVTTMHKGTIYGSLYTQKFILKTLSSVYENHLLDATIDFNGLDKHFASSALLDNTNKGKVIKYLE